MNTYKTINILDMIEAIGEKSVNLILSDFSCPKNVEIEAFIRKSAVDFAKRKISVTHSVMDEQGCLESDTQKLIRLSTYNCYGSFDEEKKQIVFLSTICFLIIRDNLTKQ